MLAVHETDELTKLGCDMDSKVTDVFARIPGRMKKPPADAAKIFAAVAAAVEEEYQVDTLSEMMELILVGQFEKLLTEAGGKATWIAWLEMIFGMRFKTGSSAPPSSQLLMHNSGNALPTNCKPTFEVKPIGALMLEAGTLANEILPEYIFEAITECEDVTAQQISAKDLTAVLDKYQHYMITHHKQPHGDKVLRSHHAKQLKARIPHLPDHGKIAGAVRKFDKILHERKRNFSRTKSLKDKAFHGLTFTQEEAENVSTLFEAAGFKPRIAERTGQLNLERRPLLLKAPPQGLDRMTKVCYPKPEGGKDESLPLQLPPQPPPQPPPVDQAARDAAEKARKTSAALAAIDAEGADETEGADDSGLGGGDKGPGNDEGATGPPKKAPSAKERRATKSAEAKAEREVEKKRKADQKAAQAAEKAAQKRQRKAPEPKSDYEKQRAQRMDDNARMLLLLEKVKIGRCVHIPQSVFPDEVAPPEGYWVGKICLTKKGGMGDVGIHIEGEEVFTRSRLEVAKWLQEEEPSAFAPAEAAPGAAPDVVEVVEEDVEVVEVVEV